MDCGGSDVRNVRSTRPDRKCKITGRAVFLCGAFGVSCCQSRAHHCALSVAGPPTTIPCAADDRPDGARFGLPIAGLASGFISSTATIGAMGARVAKTPDVLAAAVAGAVLSTIATIVQMALVLAATSMTTLRTLSVPLMCAGLAAVVYGTVFTIWALQQKTESEAQGGRAFSLPTTLIFALTLSGILVASAALREWFGETGIIVAAALAGFVDTHSAAISVASLVASEKMSAADAVIPILAGLSTNTISKMFLAGVSGGRAFALRVIPGLIVVALAAWIGMLGILVSG